MIHDVMKHILKERPVGSKNNMDILLYLENLMAKMGYDIKSYLLHVRPGRQENPV